MVKNINAQEWLNEKYPINGTCQRDNDPENKDKRREDITHLDIRKGKVGSFFNRNKNLIGSLKLEGFISLRKLIVSSHQLTGLDVSECLNLEELDCRSNENNNLNVSGCSNLKKIDCSNNNLSGLELLACPSLEVVNINNCPRLNASTINSNLYHDADNDKLVKDGLQVKNGPQVTKAKEDDIRNILIVGITGNGKSALANVLADTNQFAEKASSTSVTKDFQKSEIFEWQGKKYRAIDNIGFGDTNNISEKDVLFKIGEGIHSAKEGINQILFVFMGRFSPEHITAFKMFKDFIAETGITRFTTLVRTGFESFETQRVCKQDKESIINQSQELKEIINSCNGIIYVDNPSIIEVDSEDSEDEIEEKKLKTSWNKEKRKSSRRRVLSHLAENCREIYKLKKWDSIHGQVTEYINQIKEKEHALAKISNNSERNRLESEISENKKKVAEEINAMLAIEIGPLPKLTAQIEWRGIHLSNPFNKK